MKKGEHTPGPWTAKIYERHHVVVIHSGAWDEVATVDLAAMPDAEADARLIAAAPDLLALLEKLIDIEGPQPGTGEWANEVQAAIKKARGEK